MCLAAWCLGTYTSVAEREDARVAEVPRKRNERAGT